MTTAVKNDRIKQRFQLWDSNGNGRIERSDFETEATRLVKAFGETTQSAKGRAVMDAYLGMYDQLSSKAGPSAKDGITEEQFTSVIESLVFQQGDAGFSRVVRPTITAIVGLCDTDNDGQVSPAEFKTWLKVIGVDRSKAETAFQQIDTDSDGYLSVDELINAVRDFHFGKLDVPLLGGR